MLTFEFEHHNIYQQELGGRQKYHVQHGTKKTNRVSLYQFLKFIIFTVGVDIVVNC
jgi:hypothetical protein